MQKTAEPGRIHLTACIRQGCEFHSALPGSVQLQARHTGALPLGMSRRREMLSLVSRHRAVPRQG